MAMGSTGTVNITPEMMTNAMSIIDEYRTQTSNLYTRLSDEVTGLIPTNFSGSAAEGFRFFYTDKIEPAAGEGLTKLLDALYQICEGTLKAIPAESGLDDQLGEGNRK